MDSKQVVDPFLVNYNSTHIKVAAELLSEWLPFLSRDLCHGCTQTLSNRIRLLHPEAKANVDVSGAVDGVSGLSLNDSVVGEFDGEHSSCKLNLVGSSKGSENLIDNGDNNSFGHWKHALENTRSDTFSSSAISESSSLKMSMVDMDLEDDLEGELECGLSSDMENGSQLAKREKEMLRLRNIGRKKDFVCFERVNGRLVNVLEGLELHTSVFSVAEQKRIVNFVEELQQKGEHGKLRARTYTAPQKWMKGKGRVTLQFGCCYNYATDKKGNPPGILKTELVDPLPQLFKAMIKRLVRWHVLPSTCVPDSCIVNVYDEGDCIPPHIDNHEFVRPFCTVSFLSECNIVFGTRLKVVDAGVFTGAAGIPLPVGSVLVLKGNGADVAKHCVPSVPTKRISITFRRMDESKRPVGFLPEPDLLGLQPLHYDKSQPNKSIQPNPGHHSGEFPIRREDNGARQPLSFDSPEQHKSIQTNSGRYSGEQTIGNNWSNGRSSEARTGGRYSREQTIHRQDNGARQPLPFDSPEPNKSIQSNPGRYSGEQTIGNGANGNNWSNGRSSEPRNFGSTRRGAPMNWRKVI